jgi:hypothetical protein
MKTLFSLAAVMLTAANLYAASSNEKIGTVQVTVLDENGALVADAPIYIYGEHKTRYTGGKEIPGTTTLTMPAGNYRFSTALIKRTGEYIDRFASHEAHVQVVDGDNTSVILTLRPINDPMSTINYAELKKIGIPSEIARNLN